MAKNTAVFGIYSSRANAGNAVDLLKAAGYRNTDISVLFAENLGTLPPNTALMEVTVHGKTYELFLSTDYKKNASVEFALQE